LLSAAPWVLVALGALVGVGLLLLRGPLRATGPDADALKGP